MKIGIFSKFEMAGGSEFRCAELANGLSKLTGFQSFLLSERAIEGRVKHTVLPGVNVCDHIFSDHHRELLYSLDHLVVVNTDSRQFTTADYWLGKTDRQRVAIDLSRIRQIAFLFNFIVSPACSLPELNRLGPSISIIAANQRFFNEISEQDRYHDVRHFPRLMLESPINPEFISVEKVPSAAIRFGMHSKPLRSKWNTELPLLIEELNRSHQGRVQWDLMGTPSNSVSSFSGQTNVRCRPEFALPVNEFLQRLDVFVFFPEWQREEAWSRSVAEAQMSGCPVIATARGGNCDQVIHGNNGFLCKTRADFLRACQLLTEQSALLQQMRANALIHARRFRTQAVVERLVEFLKGGGSELNE